MYLIDSIQVILYILIIVLAFYFSIRYLYPISTGDLDDTSKVVAPYQYLMKRNKDRLLIKYFLPENLGIEAKWFEFPLPFLFKTNVENDDLYHQYLHEYRSFFRPYENFVKCCFFLCFMTIITECLPAFF